MKEAKEEFGKMLRWTADAKDAVQAEKTIFLGESIQGIYVNKRTGIGQNESTVYEVRLPDGQLVSFWGSGLLDGKFDVIPLNSEVRVEYLGIAQPKKPGGRAYQNFRVMFDDAPKPAQMREASTEVAASGADAMAPAAQTPSPAPAADDGY